PCVRRTQRFPSRRSRTARLLHSFPTRRSSDLPEDEVAAGTAPRPDAPRPDDAGTAADQVVRLLVDTPTAKAGVRPPHTLHATPEDLREAAAALRLGEGSARA